MPVSSEAAAVVLRTSRPTDHAHRLSRVTRGRTLRDAHPARQLPHLKSNAASAGLRPIRFHDLRHSFGTRAVQAFPLSDVKAYMGHADISTTMIYVHHVPQADAAAKLGALAAERTPEVAPLRAVA